MLFVVHEIAGIVCISCKSLQEHASLLYNQNILLKRLVLEINKKVSIDGSLSEMQRGAIDQAIHELSASGEYALSLAAVRSFMENMGFFVKFCLVAMENTSRDMLLRFSANAVLGLVNSISAIVVEQTEDNEAHRNTASSVRPHQLVRILPRDFSDCLQSHRERLHFNFSIEENEDIGRQKRPCASRTATKTMLRVPSTALKTAPRTEMLGTDSTTFTRCWKYLSVAWRPLYKGNRPSRVTFLW